MYVCMYVRKQRHKLFIKSSKQEVAERAKETTLKAEQGWTRTLATRQTGNEFGEHT